MQGVVPKYRFGRFTLQTGDRRLSSEGREIYLRPKAYDTLLYLLERQGHLVTKQELLDTLWADVEVTENALTRCIKEVRSALGDEVQNPVFLRTVPRLGYEFIADVERSVEPKNGQAKEEFRAPPSIEGLGSGAAIYSPQALLTARSGTPPQVVIRDAGFRKWRLPSRYQPLVLAAAFMSVALLVLPKFPSFSSRRPALAFAARDFVLVSDFENQTGDPVFDKALTRAFNTTLEQSTYANIYPRRRMTEVLKRMKRPAVDRIDEALAQEIALRDGIKVIILPSISGLGQDYRLAASIRDVASGRNVKSEVVQVNGKTEVLDAVDRLSAAIRNDLGESLLAISRRKPLSSVTTQSLEALRQYSLGTEKAQALNWDEARTYYEDALRIDPAFTAAQASLGMLHVEQAANELPHFDAQEGKHLLNEAVKHVDGLTDREKYSILAFHARAVENSAGKAIGYLKTLIALYPDDSDYHVKLGRVYREIGRLTDAIGEYQEALRIEPRSVLAYGNLAATHLYDMGNVATALPALQKMLELDPTNAFAQDALGWSRLAKNELPQAQAAFEKAIAENPQGTLSRFRLAHTYRLQGQYQQAIETLRQTQKVDPSDPSVFYDMGIAYDSMGDRSKARESFARYRDELQTRWKKNLREPGTQMNLAAAFARLGEAGRAQELLRDAMARGPQYHMEAACVLSLLGEKKRAVHQLELAIDNAYPNVIFLKIHPDLLPLHGYEEYEQLMSKLIKT